MGCGTTFTVRVRDSEDHQSVEVRSQVGNEVDLGERGGEQVTISGSRSYRRLDRGGSRLRNEGTHGGCVRVVGSWRVPSRTVPHSGSKTLVLFPEPRKDSGRVILRRGVGTERSSPLSERVQECQDPTRDWTSRVTGVDSPTARTRCGGPPCHNTGPGIDRGN